MRAPEVFDSYCAPTGRYISTPQPGDISVEWRKKYGSPRTGGGCSHLGYHFALPRWGRLAASDAPGGVPGGAGEEIVMPQVVETVDS
eukprot:3735468-Prymnesium_polylepis.1